MSDFFFIRLMESTRDCDMEMEIKNRYRCFFTAFYQSKKHDILLPVSQSVTSKQECRWACLVNETNRNEKK